jgi:lipoate---protein ligase
MQRLDLTLEDAWLNLAVDEALLEEAENGGDEVIRFWRFMQPVVVLGRGSRVRAEVDVDYCRQHDIPILRRCSGGASIVAGPDCWMYSVVLDLNARPALRNVDTAHQFVMTQLASAMKSQHPDVQLQGICDLTLGQKKFSGNSLRIARNHLIYHGTVLERVDLTLISNCLKTAPRQPEYRQGREHSEFITSIEVDARLLSDSVAAMYEAHTSRTTWPEAPALALRDTKYKTDDWVYRH